MSQRTVTLRISPQVAAVVSPSASADAKRAGIAGAGSLPPLDRITLLFCLTKDADAAIATAASHAFLALDRQCLLQVVRDPGTHPALLDGIARYRSSDAAIRACLLDNPTLSEPARRYMASLDTPTAGPETAGDLPGAGSPEDEALDEAELVEELEAEADEEPGPDEDGEEFRSKYQLAQAMGVAEKIKMALTGDKEWRSILIKDANKLVSGSVVKNPRISEAEVITILKVGVQNDEIVRTICANKEWIKNYKIRKALVDCPKTPLPNALRYLASLSEKDIAGYAKSKNISSVLSTQAKRLLLNKKH